MASAAIMSIFKRTAQAMDHIASLRSFVEYKALRGHMSVEDSLFCSIGARLAVIPS